MRRVARTDPAVLARWWWTVDRWALLALFSLITVGIVMSFAASPAVAERLGLPGLHFVARHVVFAGLAAALMLMVSLMTPERLVHLSLVLLLGATLAMVAVLLVGNEVNGARRWIQLPGFSLQPAELFKPAFAVICARLFAMRAETGRWRGHLMATLLAGLGIGLVVLQPDLGMAVMIAAIWGVEFFVAGLPFLATLLLAALACGGLVLAYFALPHVASRIDRFLDPAAGDTYQIDRSLEAVRAGGLLGTGPGEGTVKQYVPDAHADFVFAVISEEFGVLFAVLVIGLFAFVVIRGLARTGRSGSMFVMVATSGLLAQFGLQALINMGSTLSIIPTKGMTLPFISYGGSSMLAVALGMGMVLALTRSHVGPLQDPRPVPRRRVLA